MLTGIGVQMLTTPQVEEVAGDQLRFLKRQLSLPVSMMSQWWVSRSSRGGRHLGVAEDARRLFHAKACTAAKDL